MERDGQDNSKLLQELGLLSLDSIAVIDRIQTLNMRQLDRLKLMLVRVSVTNDVFSEEIREGIRGNEYQMFAKAVILLTAQAR